MNLIRTNEIFATCQTVPHTRSSHKVPLLKSLTTRDISNETLSQTGNFCGVARDVLRRLAPRFGSCTYDWGHLIGGSILTVDPTAGDSIGGLQMLLGGCILLSSHYKMVLGMDRYPAGFQGDACRVKDGRRRCTELSWEVVMKS